MIALFEISFDIPMEGARVGPVWPVLHQLIRDTCHAEQHRHVMSIFDDRLCSAGWDGFGIFALTCDPRTLMLLSRQQLQGPIYH